MTRKNILSLIVLLLLVAVLVLLIVAAPEIKSSILVGTLVPHKMTLADVREHMGSEGYPCVSPSYTVGWYLPNGKVLRCGIAGSLVEHSLEDYEEWKSRDDFHLWEVRVYDTPEKAGLREQ